MSATGTVTEVVQALSQRGFQFRGPAEDGWLKLQGVLTTSTGSHACELMLDPRFFDLPRIRLLEPPPNLPRVLTNPLLAKPVPVGAGDLDVAHAAEESCRIVGLEGFYPDRKLATEYVERFTPVLEQRLTIAGARLAGLLNRIFR